ncbi:MAG TPA: glycoside hydrolase family 15 protein [Chthoniobacterales bacterium]|nr:glycoside hydrolase family 15 protein [Chthoniobacterales bacterium]
MKNYRIQDFGLIGNCETVALVNPDGGIDWLCLPAFDGPSVFGAILDREKGGEFSIRPRERYEVEGRYAGDSAILETRFVTAEGVVVLTDFFVTARTKKARFYDFTSLHPTRRLVRTIRLESGAGIAMQLSLRARPDYARRGPAWREIKGGYEMLEAALFTSMPLTNKDGDLGAEFELESGVMHFAVLDFSDERRAPDLDEIARWQRTTEAFWREWNLFNYYEGPRSEIVRRSALTLKLLTYAPTGAFVAAPTTSLPEIPGGGSNWDYRYTWLRDTGLFIDTLFRIGYSGEAKAFLQFLVRQKSHPLPPLYAIGGGEAPAENELPQLSGYGGARPVRRGNRARDQLQLDIFAHVLEAIFYFRHTGGSLDRGTRKLAEDAIETLVRRWREPDNGIWETVERRQYTYGKVMAWTGLAAAGELINERRVELEKICAEIRDDVLAAGLHREKERMFLAAEYQGSEVDAASLLAFTSDFLPSHLAQATREEIERRLGHGALLFRGEKYRANGEGAFLLCSFWLINHLIKEGEIARAADLLDELCGRLSPLGLLAEEIDPRTGDFLGNFPQAFSHLGLIGTILNLDLAQQCPALARLSDHERFQRTVGPTVGWRGVVAGFFRVPKTVRLLFSSRSKWR